MMPLPVAADTPIEAAAEGSASVLGDLMKSLGFNQLGGTIPAVEHLIDNMDKVRNPCRNTLRLLGAILQDARDRTGDNFARTLIETFDIPHFGSWTYAKLLEQGEQLSRRMGENYVNNIRALRRAMTEVRRLCSGQPPSSTAVTGVGTGSAPPRPPVKPAAGSAAAPAAGGVSTGSPTPTPVASPPPPEPEPVWTVENPCPECQPIADSIATEKAKLDAAHKKLARLNQQRADNRLRQAQIGQQMAAIDAQLEAQRGTFAESFDPASGTRIRAENIGGGTVRVTIRDGSGRRVGGYDRPSWSANRAQAKKAELEAKMKQLKQEEQSLDAQVKQVEQDIPRLQQSIARLEQALADCVAKRCNKGLACPQPAATDAILVGPNSEVGSGARALQKATDTAKGLLGGALGGLLGGGIGGGDSFGGSGPSGPETARDPVSEGSKQSFTDPATGTSIRVGAITQGANTRVSTTIDSAPGDGTFQTIYVEDGQGRRAGPIGYWIYELWRDWSLTVSWTYDRWVNNQHVEHREGGWSESGSNLLDRFKVPVWGEGEGLWSKLGFSNAANGAKGLGTDFPITAAQLQQNPLDLVIHITQPKLDPVTTVPFVLRMGSDADGNITFTRVEQTLAQGSCGGNGATHAEVTDSGKLMLDLGYSAKLLYGTKLGWDYSQYGNWLDPGEPLELPDEEIEPPTMTLDEPMDGATPGATPVTEPPPTPGTPSYQGSPDNGETAAGLTIPATPQPDAPAVGGGPGTTRTSGDATDTGKDKEEDPRDTPPPQTYGEEQDEGPLGVLLVRNEWGWLPRFANQTQVTAQLYAKTRLNRWIPTQRSRVITLRFQRRSNEKGMDLNTHLQSGPQDSPDLFLPAGDNAHSNCSDDPSGSGKFWGTCTTKRAVSQQVFTVASRDFGSFSALEASCDGCIALKPPANWKQGVPAEAFEANAARQEQLCEVPPDDNDNQIGDAWIWELLRPGISAKDDKDAVPPGNGVEGDGLSAYEEYRGFHVKGHHLRTEPDTKDLFIDNRDNLPIHEFEKSRLALHEVNEHELQGRRINFNQGHAHVVDQHGVILVNKKLSKGTVGTTDHGVYDLLMGRIGPPKYVDEVQVDQSQLIMTFKWGVVDHTHFTVAHELGHAVMIRHHGEGSGVSEYQVVQDSSLSAPSFPGFLSWSGTVKVPSAKLCGLTLPRKMEFGTKHNTHSGHTECFMRYRYVADAYKQEDGSIDCRPTAEPDRALFCESKSGGYNAGNRVAGNAEKGECAKQIQVNDK